MIPVYILGALIAYLIGSISPSLIISKIKNKDIRSFGSKNLGASNTAILLGWKLGVLVGFSDILKGVIPVLLAGILLPEYTYLPFVVATAAVLGRIFPFYLKVKGGKGFATFLGASLGLDWRFFLGMVLVIVLVTLIFDYIAIATLTACISLPIYTGMINHNIIPALIVGIASLVIIGKHLVNIKRIAKREEIGFRAMLSKKHNI